jgi:hypothetical protein
LPSLGGASDGEVLAIRDTDVPVGLCDDAFTTYHAVMWTFEPDAPPPDNEDTAVDYYDQLAYYDEPLSETLIG